MRMLGGRVLLRHALKPAQTAGGIHIPDAYRGQAQEGVIIHAPTTWFHPEEGYMPVDPEIVPGARVLFQKHKGQIATLGDSNVRVIHVMDIIALLRTGNLRICKTCAGQGIVQDDAYTPQES